MSKARKIVVLVVALMVITSGIALAAWLVTRTTTVSGVVVGSFSFTDAVCQDAVVGVPTRCYVLYANEYNGTIYMSDPAVTTDRTDIAITGTEDLSGGSLSVGQTSQVRWDYTPDEGAAIGDVVFTVEITGSDAP